jgi:formate hydrogenlyase subunit 3/multisubunit Na+/H+ antiporter MnhD subunit
MAIFGAALTVTALLLIGGGTARLIRAPRRVGPLPACALAQAGYVLLGLGLSLRFRDPIGASGGLLHLVTAAAGLGLLYLAPRERYSRLYLLAAVASLVGLPPLGGFISKLLIYRAALAGGPIGLVVAAVAVGASLASLPPLWSRLDEESASDEGSPRSSLLPALLAIVLLVLGLWPELALGPLHPLAAALTR